MENPAQHNAKASRLPLGYWMFTFILLGCFTSIDKTLLDPDVLWHIAAGDLILQTHSIPQNDPWSYTAGNYRWMNLSWLFDIALSAAHSLQGLAGTAKLALFLMAGLAGLMAHVSYRYSGSLILSLITTILSIWCILPAMLARPHWVTYLFGLAFVYLLRHRQHGLLWPLPLMMLVWANTHGGFFIGFFVIGAFGIEALVKRDYFQLMRLTGIGGLCAITVLINPLGISIFEAVMRTMQSPLAAYLIEWQPLNIADPMTAIYLLLFLGTSGFLLGSLPLAERLLALGGFLLALSNGRMFQVAVCLSVPYFALALQARIADSPFAARFAYKDADYMADLSKPLAVLAAKALALGLAVFVALPASNILLLEKTFTPSGQYAPKGAVNYILENHPQIRFLTHYNFGGYIIYETRGRLPVFIDGRADTAYPRDVATDDLIFFNSPLINEKQLLPQPSFKELIRKYGIGGILTQRDDMLDRLLPMDGEWQRVYHDKTASVLVRVEKPAPASTLPTQIDLSMCPKRVK